MEMDRDRESWSVEASGRRDEANGAKTARVSGVVSELSERW
jgi:hypothetical protein